MEFPAVKDLIPQREPFLFLDEITALSDQAIKARRIPRAEEAFFRGHYPGHPLMPGVLLCEAVLQAGAALIAHRLRGAGKVADPVMPVLTRIHDAKFRAQVHPDDVLEIDAELVDSVANAYYMKGRITVRLRVALRLEFTVAGIDSPGSFG